MKNFEQLNLQLDCRADLQLDSFAVVHTVVAVAAVVVVLLKTEAHFGFVSVEQVVQLIVVQHQLRMLVAEAVALVV